MCNNCVTEDECFCLKVAVSNVTAVRDIDGIKRFLAARRQGRYCRKTPTL